MNLNFIGIGGAFNTELGNNSVYITENNKILFIDIGLDTFDKIIKYKLLENKEKLENIEVALIAYELEEMNYKYEEVKKSIEELNNEIFSDVKDYSRNNDTGWFYSDEE